MASPDCRTLQSPSGLTVDVLPNGSIHTIARGPIVVNLLPGSLLDAGVGGLYLRMLKPRRLATPLLGPTGPGAIAFEDGAFVTQGEWEGVRFVCRLSLAEGDTAWLWDVQIENAGADEAEFDLFYVQDVGIATPGAIGANGAYVSQYIDHAILQHPARGAVVCCRQNQPTPTGHPWLMLGSTGRATSASTDGLQFCGLSFKATGVPEALDRDELPGRRQYELSMPALQEAPFTLAPGEQTQKGFFGLFRPDHPEPTSPADLELVDRAVSLSQEAQITPLPDAAAFTASPGSLFTAAPLLPADDLTEDELVDLFGPEHRCLEQADGQVLSFFCGEDRHVVLRRKELAVERPHGHIMRTGCGFRPDEAILSSTVWGYGVFHSHVTQGNTRFNKLLTVSRAPLNLQRSTGQRIFLRAGERCLLLGVPSAFEITLNGCRWIYKHAGRLIEVRSWASPDRPELHLDVRVLRGEACELIVSHSLEADWSPSSTETQEIEFLPGESSETAQKFPGGRFRLCLADPSQVRRIGGDELLFTDGRTRGLPFLLIETEPLREFALRLVGELVPAPQDTERTGVQWEADHRLADEAWRQFSRQIELTGPASGASPGLSAIAEALPWFGHNAAIHYLVPHGLEQFNGAAWGTRDVCQGPLEMLLGFERYDEARELLCRVFAAQNGDGDWPQWFMFDRFRAIRAGDAHGDIVFWPLLAVSKYVQAAGDPGILDEILPFHHEDAAAAERATLFEHVERSLACIVGRLVPGTSLVAYGEGDWNDSMQPADPEMTRRLVSAWTVGLSYQTLRACAELFRACGGGDRAAELDRQCDAIRGDFNRLLIRDGVVAGFGHLAEDGGVKHLLHPSDETTGIHYRLLPMIRGIISGLLTGEQADRHLDLIASHLLGPDGARLMDRPPAYTGGRQKHFRRAESSSFFGREIGIMYMHAHLRYAEALARAGRADEFFRALRQAVPVGIGDLVPSAELRQSNCYYSSSDAAFADRYEAGARYDDIHTGAVALKGGWRIYSSGPGIFLGLIASRFLGVRRRGGQTILDPVIPPELDGMTARLDFRGRPVEFTYHVTGPGAGPREIRINDKPVEFTREANPYRPGGAQIPDAVFEQACDRETNTVEIDL